MWGDMIHHSRAEVPTTLNTSSTSCQQATEPVDGNSFLCLIKHAEEGAMMSSDTGYRCTGPVSHAGSSAWRKVVAADISTTLDGRLYLALKLGLVVRQHFSGLLVEGILWIGVLQQNLCSHLQ